MGTTRSDLFSEEQNDIAKIAKVLAHPARIAIIEHLLKSSTCINGELVEELGLAQATISQHLKELKNVEIIKGTIDGTKTCYCIDVKRWNKTKNKFIQFFSQIESNREDDCC